MFREIIENIKTSNNFITNHSLKLLNNLAYFNGNAFRSENEIKSDVTTPVAASSSNLSVTSTSSNIVTKKQKNADSESNHPNNIQTPQNSTCFHENQLSYSAYLSLSNLNFDANTAVILKIVQSYFTNFLDSHSNCLFLNLKLIYLYSIYIKGLHFLFLDIF